MASIRDRVLSEKLQMDPDLTLESQITSMPTGSSTRTSANLEAADKGQDSGRSL